MCKAFLKAEICEMSQEEQEKEDKELDEFWKTP